MYSQGEEESSGEKVFKTESPVHAVSDKKENQNETIDYDWRSMKDNDEQWGWSQNQTTEGPANFVKGLELYIKSLSVFSRETDPLGSVYRWPLNYTGLNFVSPLTCSFFFFFKSKYCIIHDCLTLQMWKIQRNHIYMGLTTIYTQNYEAIYDEAIGKWMEKMMAPNPMDGGAW